MCGGWITTCCAAAGLALAGCGGGDGGSSSAPAAAAASPAAMEDAPLTFESAFACFKKRGAVVEGDEPASVDGATTVFLKMDGGTQVTLLGPDDSAEGRAAGRDWRKEYESYGDREIVKTGSSRVFMSLDGPVVPADRTVAHACVQASGR